MCYSLHEWRKICNHLCAAPALHKSSATFETAPVKAFQADTLERVTERWEGVTGFCPESAPNMILIAAALDPRLVKLKFLSAEQIFKVQSTVQTVALEARRAEHEQNSSQTHTSR